MKKKILIIGPLGEFGGREIETGFIASALSENMTVSILSTIYCSKKSQIFDFIIDNQFINIYTLLYKKYFIIKLFSFFSFLKAGFKKNIQYYVNNSISKKFGFHDKATSILFDQIEKNDVVLLCAQLSSRYMKEIVDFCFKNNITVFFRPSNSIKSSDSINENWMQKVSLFIFHSLKNATKFDFIKKYNYTIIDQCCVNEYDLLKIKPVTNNKKLLYIGRISKEKGILELVNFCSKIQSITLDIIGDGPLMDNVSMLLKNTHNIRLLGYLNQNEIVKYIEISDAIVISSHEESGPLICLEAMASARIIISTNVGAMKERLNGLSNQFWFSINDFNSFETVIKIWQELKEAELKKIANDNRNRYQKEYSIKKIRKLYCKTFESF